MNINDFLALAKEFFDQLNPNFCEDYIEGPEEFAVWKLCEDFFNQMGPQV